MEVLKQLKARLFGPTCQAGGCDRRTTCYEVGECVREVERQCELELQAEQRERERVQAQAEFECRLDEISAEARAEQQARIGEHWTKRAKAGKKLRLAAKDCMTPEELEAARVRQRKGPSIGR